MADLKPIFFTLSGKKRPSVYIETGTYNGENLVKRIHQYNLLYSIEISADMQAKNIKKFESHSSKVKLIVGDSAKELAKVLNGIEESCTIFLDAHFSGNVLTGENRALPLIQEIQAIAEFNFDSITIIDDVRLLGKKQLEGLPGDPLYPIFLADWTEVTFEDIASNCGKGMSIFRNRFGSITTGRSDQLIITKVDFKNRILLSLYIYVFYPAIIFPQLKIMKSLIAIFRRIPIIHKVLKHLKTTIKLNF